MRSSTFSLGLVGAGALTILAAGGTDARTSGDGGSVTATPYSSTEPVTVPQVAANLDVAARTSRVSGDGFGFDEARVLPDGRREETAFVGRTPEGTAIRVSLAKVESFRVLDPRRPDGRVLVELTVFPALAPAELVRLQPSYTRLDEAYRKTLRLLCDRRTKLVGTVLDADDQPTKQGRYIRDLPKDATLRLASRTRWWAIPSVVDDPKYPFVHRKA